MKRTVVISGGGTGIGRAAAWAFARDGDRLVLVGRRADVLRRAAADLPDAVAHPADLTEPADVRSVADMVRDRFGTVDVLLHCAGGTPSRQAGGAPGTRASDGTFSATTGRSGGDPSDVGGDGAAGEAEEDPLAVLARGWTADFRANTLSAVLLTEALADRLASPGGRVLFVSSIAAYRGSGVASYGAAKAALHPYAHALARRLGPRGVTVNTVAPGIVGDTDFFGEDGMTEENWRARIDETLNGRAGTPGDVASTLHWLASPAAGHVTSQIVQVNGGAQRGS
ncbi:SDR family NAD(P)-dependent oxidoreductase [Streptomyces lonarensis]|uniref:SDR family oxidoreductase n=3 Tax=Streptomyces lonarensis TaxID=700599 RepID=A0A7X6D5L9_9ACTN|nr:SDR family oxidoreductase [Streptomyces lonarensis]NJQ08408.1 SDR family oxidoreductase [Streptomyces lonarensis]